MKITLEISDPLLKQAKQLAAAQGTTLRSLAEEGLTKVIAKRSERAPCQVHPIAVRGQGVSAEFAGASWERIRDAADKMLNA